jgi:anti-sigma B factor antagonist/stage II sporulation protein AA (anti-sigma F factor antagonist)
VGLGSDFDVVVEHRPGRLVVRPVGELDIATVGRLRGAITERVDGEDLVVDLRGLAFLDTSGLQLVVELHRRSQADGFVLTLVRGGTPVQRVFEIAGLEGILPFADEPPRDGPLAD